ncbi:MAG: ribonuclease III [Clostridia bacterium]|nr:ribonuclease III [Clostridia bacterium]
MALDYQQIQQKLNYNFANLDLLEQAFVHSSYANERGVGDNERMEFLGDAILEYIVSEYIYNKYPNYDAGELSKLRSKIVSADGLRPVVQQLDIMQYLLLSTSAKKGAKQSHKMEANLYEAILCAIYIDGGMASAKNFVMQTLKPLMDQLQQLPQKDAKTMLQEYCQARRFSLQYKIVGKDGPDNKPVFTCELYVNGRMEFIGVGSSKKGAEQDAANKLVKKWRIS